MPVRTLKEAWQLGWSLRVKCDTIDGAKEAHRNKALGCHFVHQLDLKTLVWTRGAIPITDLQKRLRCPACGNREVLIYWEIPNEPAALAAKKRIEIEDYRNDAQK
jgi:hypothetical protein